MGMIEVPVKPLLFRIGVHNFETVGLAVEFQVDTVGFGIDLTGFDKLFVEFPYGIDSVIVLNLLECKDSRSAPRNLLYKLQNV